jgi:hypothetical protein
MATKKKKAAKKAVKKAARHTAAATRVRTKFMSAFLSEFVKAPGGSPWPDPDQTEQSIVQDFGTFMDMLMTSGYLLQPPVPDNSGSLGDRIAKFLIAQQWPAGASVPKQFQQYNPSLRLIEVSVIADGLLKAINHWRPAGKTGGGGSIWPPH